MTRMADYKIEHWTNAVAEADYKNRPAVEITVNDRAATRQAIINRVRQNKMEFVERSGWAAHKAKPVDLENDWNYTGIAIHMAGRRYVCGPAALQLKEIQEIHQGAPRNWSDIGYHYAISCFGDIYEGRDIRFKGSHLIHFNSGIIGIVLLENLSEPEESSDGVGAVLSFKKMFGLQKEINIPEAQKDGLRVLIETLRELFSIKELGGHREFPEQETKEARLCPGMHGMRLVNELRQWSGLLRPTI